VINKVKYIFEEVYRKFSAYEIYELNLDNAKIKQYVDSFIYQLKKKYNGSIDDEFLLQFIVFQFSQFENAKTRLGTGKVYVNWILGRRALERWENKSKNWLYWNQLFIRKHNIRLRKDKVEVDKDSLRVTNSLERKRFYNTERGVLHCQELDLFDQFSKECILCKFKHICKD